MATDALLRLEQTALFRRLTAREVEDGLGHELSERVKSIVDHVAPLMEWIPVHMPEFTLHDPNHGAKVVELMGRILPPDTLDALNSIECTSLLLAGYLHDIGMTCSPAERESIVRSNPQYDRIRRADPELQARFEEYQMSGNHRGATAVEDAVLTEFLRRTHVARSAEYIRANLVQGDIAITVRGIAFHHWVIAICDSHALPVSALKDTMKWPRDALIRNFRLNVQYLSLVLRLGDILDLDPERTPIGLFDFIKPQNRVSLVEWQKHRSVVGWEITPQRFRFECECREPEYERTLRQFLGWIEEERRDSVMLATSQRDDLAEIYHLDCVDPVTTDRIRSNGSYIFSNLRFSLDYQRVLELLMGERLYGNPVLALRELLQNAFDAVRVRAAMELKGNELFKPEVTVTLEGDRLIVEDNGCGMDDEIVRKYFMQVGRSYYSSAEFRGENLQVEMTSEFGIGVLSAFMVADAMEVMSRRRPTDPLMPSVPIFLEIVAANQYFLQRPSSQRRIGTTVVLHLRKDHPFRQETLATLVASMLPFGEYPVRVRSVAGDEVIDSRRPERFRYGDFFGFEEVVRVELEGKHPELSGLKGLVRVATGRGDYNPRYCSGILAKNGFLVGTPSTEVLSQKTVSIGDRKEQFAALEQLLPGWLVVEAELDIRGLGGLQLSPARTRFIENAALAGVRVALEDSISEGLRRILLESMRTLGSEKYVEYLNHLLRGSMFGQLGGAPTLSSESIRLLQDCIVAPFAKEDGSISYRTPASWGGRDIFVIGSPDAASSDKRTELVRALEERSGGRGALVMLCGEGRDFSFDQVGRHKHVVVKRLRRGMRYLVTGVAGVVAQCFREDDEVEANWNVNYYIYPGWHTQSLSSCIESQDGTIPMVVFDSMEGHFYFGKVVWNARHPVLAPVGTPADGREVIGEAMWRIEHGLLREINRTLERENLNGYWAVGVELPTHAPATFNLASIGLLQRDGDLLPRLREVVGEYWRFLEECGLVGATEACPEISEKDFPWFWNAAPIKFGPVPQVTWNWVVAHDAG